MSSSQLFSNKFDLYKTRFANKEKVVRKDLDQISSQLENLKQSMRNGTDNDARKLPSHSFMII